MRRLLMLLLVLSTLGLAACGDGKETAGTGGAETATQPPETGSEGTAEAAPESEEGCREVDQPEPKKAGGRKKPTLKLDAGETWTATLETSCGPLEFQLDVKRAPKTASAFAALARDGYFDGLTFHRIVPGFVVQGGDPLGTGEGGPGFKVVEAPPKGLTYERGVVAMAKTELERPGTSGSQFFIVTAPDAGLPPDYALLGKLTGGDDVLDRIEAIPTDPAQMPEQPVVIEKVTISGK